MTIKASRSATALKRLGAGKSAEQAHADSAASMAEMALRPSVNGAAVAIEYLSQPDGKLSITGLNNALTDCIDELHAGDMGRAEAMLFAQAYALQSMFVNLARRGARSERPEHREASLRMALKAQNQCRMTLETLATIKNPPVVIARQANISHGPQQVNNGIGPAGPQGRRPLARTAKRSKRQNGLLEASDEQRMDTGAARTAGRADPHMEAVGTGDRAAHR